MGNSTSQLVNRNTELAKFVHFTAAEIKEWTGTFNALYPSGKMTVKDFEEVFGKLFPFGRVQKFSQRLFETINISQCKYIDINELLIAFTILWKGSSFEKTRWIFRFYDSDSDGFVSKTDLEKGIELVNEMVSNSTFVEINAKSAVENIFTAVQNQSGFLTLNDFEILANEHTESFKNIVIL